jgi:malonate-semialdehyde dehydrogenase (acetylating)/methylmalonate-semialdehyde dehydrogenase
MIPLWMMAPAVASGNAILMKPSSHDPSVSTRLAELAIEAGVPKGIFNIIHGGQKTVEALADHPDIKAISIVASTAVAKSVYGRGATHGKRMQAMGGAKNHGIIMPDADLGEVVADVLSLAYGSAGQRCMALPVIVPVGKATADAARAKLVEGIAKLRVGPATAEGMHMGPVINGEHKARVERYIQMAINEGAEVVVDGRGRTLEGHENGFFLWPTLIDHATPAMQSYQDEIFGPVLQIVRAETLDEAIGYPSNHHQGNGVAIFTRDGAAAQRFASEVEVGMVGINVPSPVPVSYHSFGGWKDSAFGDLNQYGLDSIRFFTRTKTITQRWPHGSSTTK